MDSIWNVIMLLCGFGIVAISARHIAKYFTKHKLPIITGLLATGIITGPYALGLIPKEAQHSLSFVNDIALAIIAFAASAELHLKELRNQLDSIKWNSIGQLVITFTFTSIGIYILSDMIPMMSDLGNNQRIGIAILFGAIFVARSPASAIAIINEMRAKGPFVKTVLGVTVVTDFLVIILFTFCLELAIALDANIPFSIGFIGVLLVDLLLSVGLGYLQYLILVFVLSRKLPDVTKILLIILSGYLVFPFEEFIRHYSTELIGHGIKIEPLLICIIGSFLVTNRSKFRAEFFKIIEDVSPTVFLAFFLLAGASLSIDLLQGVIGITFTLFFIRLIGIFLGAIVGGKLANDPAKFIKVGWMPYVTQAGVSLGLTTIVASSFTNWGLEFATICISVIVINQIVGPPLFKWAINIVGEARTRGDVAESDGVKDAIIFGLEPQSVALARQLMENGWLVKLATRNKEADLSQYEGIDVRKIDDLSLETLNGLDAKLSEAIVVMLPDSDSLNLCELIYQEIGTKDVIVRLNHRYNFNKFHELGTLIVDPSTAIVSLLDHFVRSPQAASLLLGMEEDQDTMDVEVLNTNMKGLRLRNLRLPTDIIILSIKRTGNVIISHGYTRLRIGDTLTMVGSKESLEAMSLKFEKM